jgi:DNA polymerase I-like protein with 3'-5' exonuclease and polymerase domains
LEILAKENPELRLFTEYKMLDKTKNTYIDGILKEQVNGFLHSFFHLNTTRTHRSSSSNINFQNQPNRNKKQKKIVRSAFIPRKGNGLLTADFKGIEVGVGACYHKDPTMIKYIKNPKSDMHGDMAIQCFLLDEFLKEGAEKTLRKGTKNGFVFPQFYGSYYGNNVPILCTWAKLPIKGDFKKNQGLKLSTGIRVGHHLINKGIFGIADFLDHIESVENDFWNKRFKVYNKWKQLACDDYYKKGYLHTLTGFTCSGLMSKNDITNYPIQGSAFHCLLKTFIEVDKRIEKYKFKSKLTGQIHDELVLDYVPKEKNDLLDIIQDTICVWLPKQWPWIIIPMEVEANVFEPDVSWAGVSKEIKLAA